MDAGNLMGGIAAAVDNILDTFSLGYNIFSNERDFDYQKSLQKQMFEREDTAVQRRMEDLKQAGLNPNLAAGSAAGAGSVVARSNTNDLNPGSLLDTVMAMQQIKNQKAEYDAKQKEIEYYNAKIDGQKTDNARNSAQLYYELGFEPQVRYDFNDPQRPITFTLNGDQKSLTSVPLGLLLQYQNNYQKNAADYMQKQNDWFVTNQVKDIVFDAIGAGTDILKPNFMKKR